MAWPRPDLTVEDSEGYVRESRARWLLGQDWSLGIWRRERLREHAPDAAGATRETTLLFGLLRSDPRPWRTVA